MTSSLQIRAEESAPARHQRPILALILITYFLVLLDASVMFTALPSMAAGLHVTLDQLSWAQDAYTLSFGGFMLLGARLGDLLGRKPVFVTGLALFIVASLFVGISPDLGWLVASRTAQGFGAAIVAPTTMALLTATFPEGTSRAKAIAAYAATAGIGSSLGLVLGGAVTEWISWQAGFLLNVPVGLVLLIMTLRFVPASRRQRGSFDVSGAILSMLGVTSLVFGIIESTSHGWNDPLIMGALVLGVVSLVLLVLRERRATSPILPLWLFSDRRRSGAYAVRAVYLGAMIGFFFFTTQVLQDGLGFSAFQAGLAYLPLTLVNFFVSRQTRTLVARAGEIPVLLAGVTLTLGGMLWFALSVPGLGHQARAVTYILGVICPMMIMGTGQGLVFGPLTTLGLKNVPAEFAGAGSGILNTAQQLGPALGLAVLVAASTSVTGTFERTSLALDWAVGLLGLALLLSLVLLAPTMRSARRA